MLQSARCVLLVSILGGKGASQRIRQIFVLPSCTCKVLKCMLYIYIYVCMYACMYAYVKTKNGRISFWNLFRLCLYWSMPPHEEVPNQHAQALRPVDWRLDFGRLDQAYSSAVYAYCKHAGFATVLVGSLLYIILMSSPFAQLHMLTQKAGYAT